MNTTTEAATTKKHKTPIAPPEIIHEGKTPRKARKPSTRETKFYFMVHNEDTTKMELIGFNSKTEINEYFLSHPGHTIESDFVVRGWAKPLKKMQAVKF